MQIVRKLAPAARISTATSRRKTFFGRPAGRSLPLFVCRSLPRRPSETFTRCCFSPARTRSRINLPLEFREGGHNVQQKPRHRVRLVGVDVLRHRDKSDPQRVSSWMPEIESDTERPQRSSFQTKTQSKRRLRASCFNWLSWGREAFAPLQPVSTYSPAISQPRRAVFPQFAELHFAVLIGCGNSGVKATFIHLLPVAHQVSLSAVSQLWRRV